MPDRLNLISSVSSWALVASTTCLLLECSALSRSIAPGLGRIRLAASAVPVKASLDGNHMGKNPVKCLLCCDPVFFTVTGRNKAGPEMVVEMQVEKGTVHIKENRIHVMPWQFGSGFRRRVVSVVRLVQGSVDIDSCNETDWLFGGIPLQSSAAFATLFHDQAANFINNRVGGVTIVSNRSNRPRVQQRPYRNL